jgi:hypothetical protein
VLAQERLPIAIGIGDAQGARAGCHQAGTAWAGTLPVELGCPGCAVGAWRVTLLKAVQKSLELSADGR